MYIKRTIKANRIEMDINSFGSLSSWLFSWVSKCDWKVCMLLSSFSHWDNILSLSEWVKDATTVAVTLNSFSQKRFLIKTICLVNFSHKHNPHTYCNIYIQVFLKTISHHFWTRALTSNLSNVIGPCKSVKSERTWERE